MRALGLPNTKHFHEITKIEDAIACTYYVLPLHYVFTCLTNPFMNFQTISGRETKARRSTRDYTSWYD